MKKNILYDEIVKLKVKHGGSESDLTWGDERLKIVCEDLSYLIKNPSCERIEINMENKGDTDWMNIIFNSRDIDLSGRFFDRLICWMDRLSYFGIRSEGDLVIVTVSIHTRYICCHPCL